MNIQKKNKKLNQKEENIFKKITISNGLIKPHQPIKYAAIAQLVEQLIRNQ